MRIWLDILVLLTISELYAGFLLGMPFSSPPGKFSIHIFNDIKYFHILDFLSSTILISYLLSFTYKKNKKKRIYIKATFILIGILIYMFIYNRMDNYCDKNLTKNPTCYKRFGIH